ncbi:DNA-binding transcriptional LysR family regulator [Herbaspirillum rubrisubalbicans]|uniref:LysR family transcriptional regulator n=1 Tax=Herbaspirillum rubrisubalbicans TaxID=80842 RepID=UPI00209E6ECC|nr:LysR family transcriptional regulator [Herbaspirillum rubrisubalbicans]MCP1572951.1 DNA-binding transcriptional LysR family regulator [Herbaspirillum rubrisubalbicans]
MTNLQSLIPFIQVVKCGSFTAAADQLGVTPPAISKSITRLEKELGVRLLQRTTRQIQLTTEGRDFFEKINALHTGIDDAVEALKNSMRGPQGLVRMQASATFGRYCLIPLLAEFLQSYPEIQLDIEFTDEFTDLLEGGFDIGVRYNVTGETGLTSRYLCSVPIVLLASPAYLARKGIPRRPEDLVEHDCINVRKPERTIQHWRVRNISVIERKGGGPDIGDYLYTSATTMTEENDFMFTPSSNLLVSGQLDVHVHAALAGIGITPVSIAMALPFLRTGQLKVVLQNYRVLVNGSFPLHVMVQYPHRKHLTPKLQVLIDFLLKRSRQLDELPQDFNAYIA